MKNKFYIYQEKYLENLYRKFNELENIIIIRSKMLFLLRKVNIQRAHKYFKIFKPNLFPNLKLN
jgi:hypothetical protein